MSSHYKESSSNNVYHLSTNRDKECTYKQYQKGNKLGEGGFAACYQARRVSDGKLLAMKIIRLTDKRQTYHNHHKDKHKHGKNKPKLSTLEKAIGEAKILKHLNHPNVVKYDADFMYDGDFYLVMELCKKGSFGDMLKKRNGAISEVEARYYLVQMVKALQYLKEKKIIHRDLKPGNYLLSEKLQLKIADFGLSIMVDSTFASRQTVCGTPNYISPEMLEKKFYSYEVDLWSIGVVLYSMLYGIAPFETKNKDPKQTYQKIKRNDYNLTDPRISSQAKDLISKILVLDPKKRISLQKILEHQFLTSFQIPLQLPLCVCEKQPEDEYLQSFSAKKFVNISSKIQKNVKQQQESFSDSFSSQRRSSYKNNQKKNSRTSLKIKVQQNQIQSLKPKGRTQILKKYQKEQVLTSSPISDYSKSIKSSSEKNKGQQYPSASKYPQQSRNFSQSFSSQGDSRMPETSNRDSNRRRQSSRTSNIDFVKIQKYNQYSKCNYRQAKNKKQLKTVTGFFGNQREQRGRKKGFWKNKGSNKKTQQLPQINNQMQIQQEYQREQLHNQKNLIQSEKKDSQSQISLDRLDFQRKKFKTNEQNPMIPQQFPSFKHQLQPMSEQYNYQFASNKYKQYFIPKFKFQGSLQTVENKNSSREPDLYSIWDFNFITSSIHQKQSNQMVKLLYCLKLQNFGIIQNPQSFCSQTFVIGLIFKDNSSIVTKVQIAKGFKKRKSMFISNISLAQDDACLTYQNSMQSQSSKQNYQQNQQKIRQNSPIIFGQQLFFHQRNKLYFQYPMDIRDKVSYVEDAISHFQRLIMKNINKIAFNKTQNVSKYITPGYQVQINQKKEHPPCQKFVFVKLFTTDERDTKIYFELNNKSKCYMQKKLKKMKRFYALDDQQADQPKSNHYRQIIYYPSSFMGYIKDLTNGNLIRNLTTTELNQYLNTWQIWNAERLNLQGTKERRNNIQQEFNHNLPIFTTSPQDLIQSLCQSFRNKMNYYYIQNKQNLLINHNNKEVKGQGSQQKRNIFSQDINASDMYSIKNSWFVNNL